ncbi:hypothetical protein H5410_058157 [Solanum commersonii]|uniref:Uncharacterized protein n=1 Tax=Solanum commersonii TaxID=4109 RepID=A0A9J5WRZ7_SOLCO|nr:hypothetical protein H5410_058157 [Solanum commersonii]
MDSSSPFPFRLILTGLLRLIRNFSVSIFLCGTVDIYSAPLLNGHDSALVQIIFGSVSHVKPYKEFNY